MREVVLDVRSAAVDDAQRRIHITRAAEPHLGGGMALHGDKEELAAAHHFDPHVISGIGLAVDLLVPRHVFAKHVTAHAPRPHLIVELQVVERTAVVFPLDIAGHVFNRAFDDLPGRDVHHNQLVELGSARVHRVCKQPVILAHLAHAHVKIGMPLGQLVLVEDDLLGSIVAATPAEDLVLAPFLGTHVITVRIARHRHRGVRLLNARHHFMIDGVALCGGVLHRLQRVGVFGLEISHHVGVFTIAQPEVLVDTGVVVYRDSVGDLARDGWLHVRRGSTARSSLSRAHRWAYESALPVLKSTTRSFSLIHPRSRSVRNAATVAPPSGAARIPSVRAMVSAPDMSSSSLTAIAMPLDVRMASSIRMSPTAAGTRRPSATVLAPSHGVAVLTPLSNARTMGAQPVDCTLTMRGRRLSIQPMVCISSNAFHMPTSPVPPPVG